MDLEAAYVNNNHIAHYALWGAEWAIGFTLHLLSPFEFLAFEARQNGRGG